MCPDAPPTHIALHYLLSCLYPSGVGGLHASAPSPPSAAGATRIRRRRSAVRPPLSLSTSSFLHRRRRPRLSINILLFKLHQALALSCGVCPRRGDASVRRNVLTLLSAAVCSRSLLPVTIPPGISRPFIPLLYKLVLIARIQPARCVRTVNFVHASLPMRRPRPIKTKKEEAIHRPPCHTVHMSATTGQDLPNECPLYSTASHSTHLTPPPTPAQPTHPRCA